MTTTSRFEVLYIEDNLANRKLLELVMTRRTDVALSLAEDGKSGLERALVDLPDLVLVDLTLPDITGYEVLNRLKSTPETSHIPVVAVSGDIPEGGGDGGHTFDKYLPKPIEIATLYSTLDEFLLD